MGSGPADRVSYRAAAALPLGAAVLLACGGDRPPAFLARDSAGVVISESSTPAWDGAAAWTIGEPDLTLGSASPGAGVEFQVVEDALELPAGGWLVADAGAGQLHRFDEAGRFTASVGGRGDGPGEFRLIVGVGLGVRDSLWVYDFVLRRLSFYDTGTWGPPRVAPLRPPIGSLVAVGSLGDGSVLLRESWSAEGIGDATEPGLRRDRVAILRYRPDGTLADTVLTLPGREVALYDEGGRVVMASPLFARNASSTSLGERLVAGDQSRYEIREYDTSGSLRRIFRRTGVRLGIDVSELEEETEARLRSEARQDRPALRRLLSSLPRPDSRPAYGALLLSPGGELWVEDRLPTGAGAWSVFDGGGRYLGRVTMPPGFTPLRVLEQRLLGVFTDRLGVQIVQIRPIRRPGVPLSAR